MINTCSNSDFILTLIYLEIEQELNKSIRDIWFLRKLYLNLKQLHSLCGGHTIVIALQLLKW